jgi:hypothetical protein
MRIIVNKDREQLITVFPDQLFDRCAQRGMLNLGIILQVESQQ